MQIGKRQIERIRRDTGRKAIDRKDSEGHAGRKVIDREDSDGHAGRKVTDRKKGYSR